MKLISLGTLPKRRFVSPKGLRFRAEIPENVGDIFALLLFDKACGLKVNAILILTCSQPHDRRNCINNDTVPASIVAAGVVVTSSTSVKNRLTVLKY